VRQHVVPVERFDARAERVAGRNRLGAPPGQFVSLAGFALPGDNRRLDARDTRGEPVATFRAGGRRLRGRGFAHERGPGLRETRELGAHDGRIRQLGQGFDGFADGGFAPPALFLRGEPGGQGGFRVLNDLFCAARDGLLLRAGFDGPDQRQIDLGSSRRSNAERDVI
jgi:hypothetical protein